MNAAPAPFLVALALLVPPTGADRLVRMEAISDSIRGRHPSTVTLISEPLPGVVELSTGVAVSPRHAVTLALFQSGFEPAVVSHGELFHPDTAYYCPDLGLVLLRFPEDLFEDYTLPSERLPGRSEHLAIVGQGIGGLVETSCMVMDQASDGALVVSVEPRAGLMGAAAFDSIGEFVGLVKGVVNTQMNQFQQARTDRLALLPSQIWSLWAEVMIFEQAYPGAAFGVTAVSYAPSNPSSDTPSGVLLVAVDRDGRAWQCGLRPGDVVVEVDGVCIYHPVTLMGLVVTSSEEMDLAVWRRGAGLDLVIDAPPHDGR